MAISPGFAAGGMPRSILVVVLAVSVFCSGVVGIREQLDSGGSEDVRRAVEVWGSRGEIGRSREAGVRTGLYVEGDAGIYNVDSNSELSVDGFRVRRDRAIDDSRNTLERPAAPVRRIEAGGDSVDATGDAFGRQNAVVNEEETIHLTRGRFLLGGAPPPPDYVKRGEQSTGDARAGPSTGPSQSKDQRTSDPTSDATVGDADKKKPPPPSPVEQPPPKNDTDTKDLSEKAPPPPPTSPPPVKVEPSFSHRGKCDHEPVTGKLVASGEDGSHDYNLALRNDGEKSELNVNVVTSKALSVNPESLVLKKGESKTVTVTVIDREAAKLGANITIIWAEGDCLVDVPSTSIQGAVPHSPYFSLITLPGSGVLLLGGTLFFVAILGIAGVWGCLSWRARSRRHGEGNAKYQELEMSLPTVDISKKEKEEISPSAEGWDEVWEDDEWEDTEAVRSSSTSLTLSANGLNSRRANKEGWDNAWDE